MSSYIIGGIKGKNPAIGERKVEEGWKPNLPFVLFAGFRSCALEVKSSFHRQWVGERVWLSVAKLRIFGSGPFASQPRDSDEKSIADWLNSKSLWVQHVGLNTNHDGFSDPEGVVVRAIPGARGMDFLEPGSFTGRISYVFGYVIKMLQDIGYKENESFIAASYDWRIPPCKLEERDGFFSQCIQSVETLYTKNQKPVVLVSHSMGCKTVHYFLHWAVKHKGQAWVDKYVHSIHAAAAPWLGVPRAARSVLTGDKMGLDTFLTDDDAAYLARSWGSAPFVFPTGTDFYGPYQSFMFSRVEGVINVQVVSITLPDKAPQGDGLKYFVELTFGGTTLKTSGRKVAESKNVSFEEHFQFVSSAAYTLTDQDVISVRVQYHEHSRGLMPFTHTKSLGKGYISAKHILEHHEKDYVHTMTLQLGSDLFEEAPPGQPVPRYRPDQLKAATLPAPRGVESGVQVHNDQNGYIVNLQISWVEGSGRSERRLRTISSSPQGKVEIDFKLNGEISNVHIDDELLHNAPQLIGDLFKQAANDAVNQLSQMTNSFGHMFEPRTLRDLLKDGARESFRQWENFYNQDPLYGEGGVCLQPPPVKKLRCIYGTTIDTEMMHFYRRRNMRKDRLACPYILDETGTLEGSYVCSKGIAYETPETLQTSWVTGAGEQIHNSGDGLVPYASLHYAAKWATSHDIEVSIREVEGAEHHSILSNTAYLDDLLVWLATPPSTAKIAVGKRFDTVRRTTSLPMNIQPGISDSLEADISSLLQYVELVDNDDSSLTSQSDDAIARRRPSNNIDRLKGLFYSSATLNTTDDLQKMNEVTLTGRLLVAVEGAYNLKANDTIDAYCVIQLGQSNSLRKVARTNVIKKTLNPVWKEVFDVVLIGDSILAVKVKDWDAMSMSDTCGRGQYTLAPVADGKECAIRINLRPQGHLILRLKYTPKAPTVTKQSTILSVSTK